MIVHAMTATPADEPATDPATDSATDSVATSTAAHSCEHCDSTEDHTDVDERAAVLAFRSAMRGADIGRAFVAVALLLVAVTFSGLGLLAGAAAWLLVTAVGMLALSMAN